MKGNKRDLRLFIKDILENINLIESFSKNISKDGLSKNELKQYAIIRALEIIGEATKHIPDSFRKKYPKVPWKDIAGFRDVVIHAYFGVILERVWKVIQEDLPNLKIKIQKILEDLEKQQKQEK